MLFCISNHIRFIKYNISFFICKNTRTQLVITDAYQCSCNRTLSYVCLIIHFFWIKKDALSNCILELFSGKLYVWDDCQHTSALHFLQFMLIYYELHDVVMFDAIGLSFSKAVASFIVPMKFYEWYFALPLSHVADPSIQPVLTSSM